MHRVYILLVLDMVGSQNEQIKIQCQFWCTPRHEMNIVEGCARRFLFISWNFHPLSTHTYQTYIWSTTQIIIVQTNLSRPHCTEKHHLKNLCYLLAAIHKEQNIDKRIHCSTKMDFVIFQHIRYRVVNFPLQFSSTR